MNFSNGSSQLVNVNYSEPCRTTLFQKKGMTYQESLLVREDHAGVEDIDVFGNGREGRRLAEECRLGGRWSRVALAV